MAAKQGFPERVAAYSKPRRENMVKCFSQDAKLTRDLTDLTLYDADGNS